MIFFNSQRTTCMLGILFFVSLLAVEPALAQQVGGLDKVNSFTDSFISLLRGISIGVVTIAIMWAGYKFLFKHAEITEVIKIVAGGLLIGCIAELVGFLLN